MNILNKKISSTVGILAELKSFLPKPAVLKLYSALVHFQLLHGLAIWGSTFFSYLNKLALLQNKAVKLDTGGKYRDHVTLFCSQLNVIKLSDLVMHKTPKIFLRHLHSHLTPLLSPLFIKLSQISTRITRAVNSSCCHTVHIHWYSTNRLQKSILQKVIKIWNNITLATNSLPNKRFDLQYQK